MTALAEKIVDVVLAIHYSYQRHSWGPARARRAAIAAVARLLAQESRQD